MLVLYSSRSFEWTVKLSENGGVDEELFAVFDEKRIRLNRANELASGPAAKGGDGDHKYWYHASRAVFYYGGSSTENRTQIKH